MILCRENINCNIDKCKPFTRNNRDRDNEDEKEKAIDIDIDVDIGIFCGFIK